MSRRASLMLECTPNYGKGRMKFPKFNPKTENKNPDIMLGLIFSSKKEAKFAIESHCFRRGMMVKFPKNDAIRLRAVCKKEGCGWYIHVSKMQNDHSWQVKTYNPRHTKCSWNYNNTSLKSGWIGKIFMKKLKDNPKLGTNEFRSEICTTLKANITRSQAYRARKKAIKIIQGTLEEQFSKIYDYCLEIERTNPGSTVIMKLTEERRFHRLYMCFNACKVGFKNGCRPIIGVDGCFLKGGHGGQLLTVVGLDPNNNIFPIAYAIVESETKDSWIWFLNLLNADIGFENEHNWTFMSDKQKWLIPAFETLFPNAENRFCVRHLHSNMKRDGVTGLAIKTALWGAAKATRVEEFNRKMQELRDIDEDAYQWLVKKPPQNWTRSHFSPHPKCDILLNNMCECFNSFILEAREKPIISLLETIRNLLMTRVQSNKEKAAKWEGLLCPKIKKILMKIMEEAGECISMKCDDYHFQIIGPFDQHTVDLLERKCSCKKWDLSGIPCKHACSAIWCRNEESESYVHNCYKVETYLQVYEPPILGFNGPELWPKSSLEAPLPPNYIEKAGRPQRLRRREPDEPPAPGANPHRLRGIKRNNKCKTCGGTNHNSKTCKKRKFSAVEQVQASQSGTGDAVGQQNESVFEVPQDYLATQASVSSVPPQRKTKLQVKRPSQKNVNVKGRTNTIAFQASKSSPTVNTPVIVKGGLNFITLNNLKASVSHSKSAGASHSKSKSKSVGDSSSNAKSVGGSASKAVGGSNLAS
ncbi:PREDICTED: uncharacterized protein LOC105971096 [Erythranthe guttata]|uniref:uncharacterized protein LOC105971096 n=1 Tax=Erythranthe guttata TaxID=4155 RepID=UPI00064E05FB|nr:PREDICTED: uncharacterized protein LOC105971096 [Erythranthe guttata]|eukprot:XP_012851396.1 PREDICTED: uncharacterized protein LOC105971096 [Erythranthe guttata]